MQIAAPPECEAAARRFYGELLGLIEVDKPVALRSRGGLWFDLAGAQLHIGVQDPFTAARQAHPALRVDAVALDALARRLTDAGAPVRWDDELAGGRRFFTDDPWGNRLELLALASTGSPGTPRRRSAGSGR